MTIQITGFVSVLCYLVNKSYEHVEKTVFMNTWNINETWGFEVII